MRECSTQESRGPHPRTATCVFALLATSLVTSMMSCGANSDSLNLPPLPPGVEVALCPAGTRCGPRSLRCLRDERGNIVLEDCDRNGDGRVDTRTTYTYGIEGELVLKEVGRGIDGMVDEQYRWDFLDGHLREQTTDRDGDGIVDSRVQYETDETGLVIVEEHDGNSDDTIDQRGVLEYNELGNRIGRSVDFGVDGVIDRRCSYRPPYPPPYAIDVCAEYLFSEAVLAPLPPVTTPDEPSPEPPNVFLATLEQLADEQSMFRSSDHTLVLFTVHETAWRCPPCEHMCDYFSWRAGSPRRRDGEKPVVAVW